MFLTTVLCNVFLLNRVYRVEMKLIIIQTYRILELVFALSYLQKTVSVRIVITPARRAMDHLIQTVCHVTTTAS